MDDAAADATFGPAARAAVEAFPVAARRIELVSMSENVTYRVAATDGASYVLRLHRPGYHTLDELVSERVWIRALAAAGIAVPAPVRTRGGDEYTTVRVDATGERRHAGLARWIDGTMLADLLRDAQRATREDYFAQLGALVATLHDQASIWSPPQPFPRHAFDADGLLGERPFWGRFWEHPDLAESERQLLLATRARMRAVLDRRGRGPAAFGMIHADLHPSNVLLAGDRLAIIDFDDAGFGWHLYDIAVALFHQRLASRDYATAERAFLRGYRSVRAFSEEDAALIPMFLVIRGMVTIGWIRDRPELDTRQYFARLRDFVCEQCRALELPR
jgi:Ser/Thr protein kinase RdoA (MazF antagonist)